MKIYINTTKRISKKRLGRRWPKIIYGATLKSGDIVSTCRGYNEVISVIEPEWTNHKLSKGWHIFDFQIELESGGHCSLVNCCTIPPKTLEEILAYWSWYNTDKGKAHIADMESKGWSYFDHDMLRRLELGQRVFDKEGLLIVPK